MDDGTTIADQGYPLVFRTEPWAGECDVALRTLVRHQKEALVVDGAAAWRLASDEGAALGGDDLAPFPIGFYVAGALSDIRRRLHAAALVADVDLGDVRIGLEHVFTASGSFADGSATAGTRRVSIRIDTRPVDSVAAIGVVTAAFAASPVIAFLRTPLSGATTTMTDPAAPDPFAGHGPMPIDPDGPADLIVRTDAVEPENGAAPPPIVGQRFFSVRGDGSGPPDRFVTETWIARPGMRRFRITTDETGDSAPSGLASVRAGVALCFMTQLMRAVHAGRLPVERARLTQSGPFELDGRLGPIDTRAALIGGDGDSSDLLRIARSGCFLHTAAAASILPEVVLAPEGGEEIRVHLP